MQVSVPVVTPEQCATTMGPMDDGKICAGGVLGEDSCKVIIHTTRASDGPSRRLNFYNYGEGPGYVNAHQSALPL